jgi:uncharacterized membrane protein
MPEEKGKKPAQELARNHIPKQVMSEKPAYGRHEPARMAAKDKPHVIIKQTPVPEVRIYGQSAPRKYALGQKAADKITKWAGSWTFIGGFFIFLVIWMAINVYMIVNVWDPYPFILLNLVLSCLAAIQAPIILMSQNRAADRDRAKAERDYAINRKSEREVELIKKDLDHIKKKLAEIGTRLK